MKAALQNYQARMRRVLDHIDRHLDDDLDLESLSAVAAFSKFHFHRQFSATFGLSVHSYVQLARLKRASYQLAFADAQSVTDIAMDAGYEAPDAFARAFRQRFGQSPSSFRNSPEWEPWLAAFGPLDIARSKLMQRTFTTDDVTIREVPTTKVAIMEHRGDPATLPATIQRFIAWRKAAGLHPGTNPTFNVALYLYRNWLPGSGEEVRDFPIYCQRLSFFPEVPEHETVAELFSH
ncbi:AraC family transcriptional regulator [Bradyrhizobium diversitatis]|uniref:AraC family transcriptional regulator n=1 Tax=Bradyrhizobium diversitatis TaxID=2755406 RepID=A0ABS0P3J8_9BRAD|nr:helix-turn-helix domain-containing protein [Bradyrhizobium diversitatis]MBH5387836.1 AraC family transcriptional regulator [Bradyrhizobium diversitatis]